MAKRLKLLPLTETGARNVFYSIVRNSNFSGTDLREVDGTQIDKMLTDSNYPTSQQLFELQKNHNYGIVSYENLLDDSGWEIEATEGLTVRFSQIIGGEEFFPTTHVEHGIVRIAYKADFSDACKARDRAIENSDIGEFYNALAKMFAAVDGIINFYVEVHNRFAGPENQLSEKRKGGKGFMSLDEKLLQLVPAITGRSVNVNDSGWKEFEELKALRNKSGIHPKPGEGITSLEQLADGLNKFGTGLGGLMFMLYNFFGEPIPPIVCRATFYPQVVVERFERK